MKGGRYEGKKKKWKLLAENQADVNAQRGFPEGRSRSRDCCESNFRRLMIGQAVDNSFPFQAAHNNAALAIRILNVGTMDL